MSTSDSSKSTMFSASGETCTYSGLRHTHTKERHVKEQSPTSGLRCYGDTALTCSCRVGDLGVPKAAYRRRKLPRPDLTKDLCGTPKALSCEFAILPPCLGSAIAKY